MIALEMLEVEAGSIYEHPLIGQIMGPCALILTPRDGFWIVRHGEYFCARFKDQAHDMGTQAAGGDDGDYEP